MTWGLTGLLLVCVGGFLGLVIFGFLVGHRWRAGPPPWHRAALLGTVVWVLACGVLLGLPVEGDTKRPFAHRFDGLAAAFYLAGAAVYLWMAWRPDPRALPPELGGNSPRALRVLALLFAFMGVWRLTDFVLG